MLMVEHNKADPIDAPHPGTSVPTLASNVEELLGALMGASKVW